MMFCTDGSQGGGAFVACRVVLMVCRLELYDLVYGLVGIKQAHFCK